MKTTVIDFFYQNDHKYELVNIEADLVVQSAYKIRVDGALTHPGDIRPGLGIYTAKKAYEVLKGSHFVKLSPHNAKLMDDYFSSLSEYIEVKAQALTGDSEYMADDSNEVEAHWTAVIALMNGWRK